jgi:hypothetical protein
MKIQSNHSLLEALRCKAANNDVSKKTISKISEKLRSVSNLPGGITPGYMRGLRDEISNVKGDLARHKLELILDKHETKKIMEGNSGSVAVDLTLVNMGLKSTIKNFVSNDALCRQLTSKVGEMATIGQNDPSFSDVCLKTLKNVDEMIRRGDTENANKTLDEGLKNFYSS